MAPDAATAGTPIPGNVESPQTSSPAVQSVSQYTVVPCGYCSVYGVQDLFHKGYEEQQSCEQLHGQDAL